MDGHAFWYQELRFIVREILLMYMGLGTKDCNKCMKIIYRESHICTGLEKSV